VARPQQAENQLVKLLKTKQHVENQKGVPGEFSGKAEKFKLMVQFLPGLKAAVSYNL
jgi:hypothetical protein